jgi:hypothetical protein
MKRRSLKKRRRSPRRRNPNMTDMLLLAGVVGVAGLGIWFLASQSASAASTTPVSSTQVNGQTVALNAAGQVIPTSSLTPAQQGALAAQQADAVGARNAQPTGSAAAT